MSPSPPALEGSLVLGRYRIVKPLARGGMGMVYLGRVEGAAGFAKPVVIKRILSEAEETTLESAHVSFIREARILSELQHPGIVGVLDFGHERDTYLMVLEYVHGYHLGHWLRFVRTVRGELEWEFALYVLLRVLAALQHAHRHVGSDGQIREVIHRDISPGNILIDFAGNVRLVDFGIARSTGNTGEFQTQDGVVKGKLPYIAPEIYRSREASVSSDVYAAGVVLYQLLTGTNPFSDRDMSKIVRRVLEDVPPPISALRGDLPDGLDEIVARALAKDPEARFPSASELANALRSCLRAPESELAEQFRIVINEDFGGQLPEVLDLESLSSLDAAWRAAAPDPGRAPSLRSSIPPPPDGQTLVVAVDGSASAPESARDESRSTKDESKEEPSTSRASPKGLGRTTPARATSSRLLILLSLGFAATLGALLVLLLGKPPEKKDARFLLVERPASRAAAAAREVSNPPSAPSPAASGAPPETAPEPEESPAAHDGARGESTSRPRPPSGADALTAAFAKRQAAVQGCFSKNASALQGSPQITIRFRLDPRGSVQSATLSPAALAGTGLGDCLVGVARSTQFPAQGKAVSFSIPITARVVDTD